MSNQSPCTDPTCPCTALTLAEKNYALEQLTWLRKHMLVVNFREDEAVDAAIRANDPAGPFQDGCITHHKRFAAFIHFGVLQRFDRNLRSDTCRVAHCDA